jgi:toxin ParE1/3/4
MIPPPLLLHPEALTELREAAQRYEASAAGLGEEFVSLFERRLDAAAAQASPGTNVPYACRADVRWLLLLPRFPFAIILLLDPRSVIAVAHLHRKPGYWRKRLPRRGSTRAR